MELKANELRLNNLFIEENTKKIIKVIALEENRIVFSGMFLKKRQAKAIPLTEELILKYGKNSIFSNGYSYRITKLGRVEILLGVAIITVIDYLHEFQNLNFALLGCEIEEYEPLY